MISFNLTAIANELKPKWWVTIFITSQFRSTIFAPFLYEGHSAVRIIGREISLKILILVSIVFL